MQSPDLFSTRAFFVRTAYACSLLIGGSFLADGRLHAAEQPVSCPTQLALSSSLGGGWQGPGGAAPLASTGVEQRDGQIALVCDYGASGQARRPMPAGFVSCLPTATGFTCSDGASVATGSVTLVPRLETVADLRRNDGLNLDNGRSNTLRRDDLVFARFGGNAVLQAVNGARFSAPLRVFRGPNDCLSADYRARELILNRDVGIGTAVCYRTNRGRTGVFLVRAVDRGAIRLAITTWDEQKQAPTPAGPQVASRTTSLDKATMPARTRLEFQFASSPSMTASPGNAGVVLSATGGATEHYAILDRIPMPAGPSVMSFDVRPDTMRHIRVQLFDGAPNGLMADIDLANRTAEIHQVNFAMNPKVSMEAISGGWIRVRLSGLYPALDRRVILQILDGQKRNTFQPRGETMLVRNLELR